ncbi:hypothetical protein M3201_21260 [Paenibacillus motobuensis]|uniref:hypothetical protein n=1 Tax=Paenibacillus TaxID=44249 RepID=UPI00203F6050|nr:MULTISPECIES: hypothetical protein [Paenibacillus]MCM3042199.1 hypothetical protein [Paenibacillus lutimineralis]MCM3649303.1 hypothetical protein [Paenibacillus motobuensis]
MKICDNLKNKKTSSEIQGRFNRGTTLVIAGTVPAEVSYGTFSKVISVIRILAIALSVR